LDIGIGDTFVSRGLLGLPGCQSPSPVVGPRTPPPASVAVGPSRLDRRHGAADTFVQWICRQASGLIERRRADPSGGGL